MQDGTVFGPVCKDARHRIDAYTAQELAELFDRSEQLQWRNYRLNDSTETVVNLTPTDVAPKTENCTKLFNQAGVAPDVLTLNPGGYILLKQGAAQSVAITGGKAPYDVRLMCDCYGKGITATTQYDGGKASIKIIASGGATAGSYPLMVADSTGIGRPLTLVVLDASKTDYSDEPDCALVTTEPVAPNNGQSGKNIAAAVKAASNAAQAADQKARQSANQAVDIATKADSLSDRNKLVAALSKATAAANKTKKYAASAQTYAKKVSALVADANDQTLRVYDEAAQAAATDAATRQNVADDAVKRIAHRLPTVIGKPGPGP